MKNDNLEKNDILSELDNIDVLTNIDFIDHVRPLEFDGWEDYIKETVKDKVNNKKEKNLFRKILVIIGFLFKYSLTSLIIFSVLLFSTNYSAYYNIINSYINSDKLEQEQEKLINSVNATDIEEKLEDKLKVISWEEEKTNTDIFELESDDQTLNDYSIDNFLYKTRKEKINLWVEIIPYDNRIVIPKIWENIPLIEVENQRVSWEKELNDIFMKELENWVVRYPSSQKPWEEWNTFIFWHSSNFPWIKWDYNDIFALLDKVVFDDQIIVYYWQEKYVYKIREKHVISPWDVSLIWRNKNKSEITLMTCWPIWTTLNRLVVIWELQE